MVLTFALMGAAICGIALTPSYHSIGPAAPILVLVWRLLQGFSLGGELGPATAFLIEAAPAARRGFYGSLQYSAQAFSAFLAGLVGFCLSSGLSTQSLSAWGWRIAFLLGGVVVPIGLVIRRSLPETLSRSETTSPSRPAIDRSYMAVAILGFVILSPTTIRVYVRDYLTTYVQATLSMDQKVAFAMTMVSYLAGCFTFPISGWLSDRVGRKPIMVAFTGLYALMTIPAFLAIIHFRSAVILYMLTTALTVIAALAVGPVMTAITESLPQRARAGMLGTVYAVEAAVFGSLTQLAVAWLTGTTRNALVPAWVMTVATLLGLAAMIALPESAPVAVAKAEGKVDIRGRIPN
jgi:MFS transporter, MHS family, citrate/tricarballylate:H+ symporter